MSVIKEKPCSEPISAPTIGVTRRKSRSASLLRFAWWTIPLHLLLGFGFWWMVQHESDQVLSAIVGVHVAFPVLLLMTVRWWWSRWGELLVLLLVNHLVTFSVLICLPWS